MAVLQVSTYAGVVGDLEIPDGPPTARKLINSGASGTVYGGDSTAAVCDLVPIGGNVDLTWPNGVTETLTMPVTRRLRGEAVSVA